MEKETRREKQRRILVDDILGEAMTQLDANGPTSVSLRAIARSVGMSAPSLYTYFPSLSDLFTALIVQSYESLADYVAAALDEVAGETLEYRLEAGPRAYRHWALANRQRFNLIFFDQITNYTAPPEGPTIAAQIAALRPMASSYAQAIGVEFEDLLEPGQPLTGFLGWWGSFHGVVALEVNHHFDWVDSETIFEQRLKLDIATILETPVEDGH